jgi:putative zinc finger protein
MTRDAFADQLLDLAYGELSPRDARKVEAHAASCEACRAELAKIRETRGLMARLPEEPAPEKGERVLLAAAREAAERRAAPRRFLPPWAWGASVVAASILAVAAVSYRILALRPGPLSSRPDREALLGESYATPPAQAPAPAEQAAPPARAERPSRAFASPPPPAVGEAAPAERKLPAPRAADARPDAPGAAESPAAAPPDLGAAPEARRAAPAPPPAAPSARAAAPSPPPAAAADAAPRARRVEQEAAGVRREAAPAAKASAAPRGAASGTLGAQGGGPRSTTRSFPGCEGELARTVVTDEQGRVVRSVREGRFDGRRLRIVQTFGPDGAPASAAAQDLDAGGAAVDPRALGIALADRAEDADLDAPPRCGR